MKKEGQQNHLEKNVLFPDAFTSAWVRMFVSKFNFSHAANDDHLRLAAKEPQTENVPVYSIPSYDDSILALEKLGLELEARARFSRDGFVDVKVDRANYNGIKKLTAEF